MKMFRNTAGFLFTLALLLILAPSAVSQQAESLKTPPWLQLSFEHRTRYEHLINPFRLNVPGSENHLFTRTRLSLGLGNTEHPVQFFVELQDSRAFINSEDLYSAGPHINKLDFLQAHLRFNLNQSPSQNSENQVVLGRFTMDLGKRRLSARNRMRNTTNAFDGVLWTLSGKSDWAIRTFLTRPVTIDPDNPDLSGNRYFWGIFFESRHYSKIHMDLYYLGLHSNEQATGNPRYTVLGGRFYKVPASGTFDYEIESVYQFGRNRSLDHLAYFHHGEIGYSFMAAWLPRVIFQYDYASGDSNPEDSRSGRFDTLFGARRFDFNPTGIYGPFYRSNINTPGIRIIFNPIKNLQIMAAYRRFRLAQARDAWAGSGLQDSTGMSGKSLGRNFETRLQWQANSHLSIDTGYARLFKGSYLNLLPESPKTGDSNFFYIATEIKARLLPY